MIYKITDHIVSEILWSGLNKKTIFYVEMIENKKHLSVYWNILDILEYGRNEECE